MDPPPSPHPGASLQASSSLLIRHAAWGSAAAAPHSSRRLPRSHSGAQDSVSSPRCVAREDSEASIRELSSPLQDYLVTLQWHQDCEIILWPA